MTAIRAFDLSKSFEVAVKKPGLLGALRHFFRKETKNVEAVKKISFTVGRGELVGFLGPNGAGKTTTLKMLSGLLYPTSGELELLGHVPWKREKALQMQFSMVMGQRTQLWWDLPVRETFLLNQKIYEIPDAQYRKTEGELIALLELEELVDVPAKRLSLGERMKAELACALLHQPQVLLLDEPTLGLDIVMQKKLRHFIKEYNQKTRSTILLTSHNMSDVEELCQRVMIIHHGRLLYDGDLEKIVTHYAPEKLVSLTAAQELKREELTPFGRVVSINQSSAKLEIPRQNVSAAVAQILNRIRIVDLAIEEIPIEDIIRKVFAASDLPEGLKKPPASNAEEKATGMESIESERTLP